MAAITSASYVSSATYVICVRQKLSGHDFSSKVISFCLISFDISVSPGMTLHRLLRCKTLQALSCRQTQRCLSTSTEGEIRITKVLKEKFPQASSVKVVDISGGCGAMYEVHVESDDFRGKRIVQQHQLVNQALKEEIKEMHGLRIFTDVPKK